MTCTVETARDEIYTLLKDAWSAAPAVKLFYDDTKDEKDRDLSPWARISVRHNDGGDVSISRGNGKGRYGRTGTVYVNLFAQPGDGLRILDPLVKIVLDAYEGKTTPSQVWFKRVRVREQGIVKGWYQTNVLIDFSYDEIK
jgi:hypothetical protein